MTLDPADLVTQPGQGERTAADMTMIVRSGRLGGHFSIMEGEVRPRELLAFHTHEREDQHMYILEGELHFEIGGRAGVRFTAGEGCHVLKPRGHSHGFWNLGHRTARYVETSTQDGFERFVDQREQGLGAMMETAQTELGMSFELRRSLKIMREFGLVGLAGANLPPAHVLVRDPFFRRLVTEVPEARDMFLRVGSAKLREAVQALFS